MSAFNRPKHVWEAVGFDCETFEPNIWRCPYCETYKSLGQMNSNHKNKGVAMEYTDAAGELIQPIKIQKVPPCIPKDAISHKDRPVIVGNVGA